MTRNRSADMMPGIMQLQLAARLACIAVALVSCKKDDAKPSQRGTSPQPGAATIDASPSTTIPASVSQWYRGELSSGDTVVPIFFSLPTKGSGEAVIRKGAEELKVPATWKDTEVEVPFKIFQSALRARKGEDGVLEGEWHQESGSWGESRLSLQARPVEAPDFAKLFSGEGSATDVSGTWKLAFPESGESKLHLESDGSAVVGEIFFTSGNITALGGEAVDGKLRLAGFDGTSPYLLTADVADGKLTNGSWTAGAKMTWVETFDGVATEDFELTTGPKLTATSLDVPGVDLSFYKGKPTIVEMAGSWCITCRFAAPFLRTMYEKYHSKGLEIITVTYEFTDDEAYNTKKANEFKNEYQLAWEVIPVHGDVDDFAEIMPSSLSDIDVSGFPISIFVGRDSKVQHVHAGFPSVKDSEVYKQATAEYEGKIQALLQE